jgi:DNA-directed RNA polymerase subunit RPC12/RpoP
VKCKECGSKNVYLENNLGFSDISGGWGSIDMICSDCGNKTEIVEV